MNKTYYLVEESIMKKVMKQAVAVVLAMVMIFTIVACAAPAPAPAAPTEPATQAPAPAPAPAPTPAPAPAPAPPPAVPPAVEEAAEEGSPFFSEMVIAFLPVSVGGAFFTRMFHGFGIYSGLTGSQTFEVGPTVGDAALQNRFVEDLIAQGVDAIGMRPFIPEQSEHVLGQARAAGIIVVTSESDGMTNADKNIEAFNHAEFSATSARLLAEGMGGEGELILFVGSLGSTSHMNFATGIFNYISDNFPNIILVQEEGLFIETGNNAALSYERAREAFMAHPNVRGVFCPSATDTPSIARAIEEAGLIDQVTYVAIGLPNANRTFVQSGAINHLMAWDPANIGLLKCMVASGIRNGVTFNTGDDLGVFGFDNIVVRGNTIFGNDWLVIDSTNVQQHNF